MKRMVEKLPNVVICSRLIRRGNGERSRFENLLLQSYPSISVSWFEMKTNPEPFAEDLKSAEIIVADAKDFYQLLPFAPNLKWFSISSAGVNLVLDKVGQCEGTPQYPFTVTRMGGTYHSAMAEYVIAQIISRERQFEKLREAQKIKGWDQKYQTYRILKELTIGIIGAGDIGVEVARCCKCFGMKTIGLCKQDRPKEQRSQYIDVYLSGSKLSQLLAESDYICSILPSSPDTDNFFQEDTFSHCTKKPVFINVGRGNCVREETIINAIRNGWLSGAILDVTKPEPLPKESKLWTMPEVVITPHVGGFASETVMFDTFVNNLQKFLRKQPLNYEIDFSKKY